MLCFKRVGIFSVLSLLCSAALFSQGTAPQNESETTPTPAKVSASPPDNPLPSAVSRAARYDRGIPEKVRELPQGNNVPFDRITRNASL